MSFNRHIWVKLGVNVTLIKYSNFNTQSDKNGHISFDLLSIGKNWCGHNCHYGCQKWSIWFMWHAVIFPTSHLLLSYHLVKWPYAANHGDNYCWSIHEYVHWCHRHPTPGQQNFTAPFRGKKKQNTAGTISPEILRGMFWLEKKLNFSTFSMSTKVMTSPTEKLATIRFWTTFISKSHTWNNTCKMCLRID